MRTRKTQMACACLALFSTSSLFAQSVLIPETGRRDHVFDPARNRLYISTDDGDIQRYDLNSQSSLAPWSVGVSLNGLDIMPDSTAIYVAENQVSGQQGLFRKVALDTGAVTNIPYALTSQELGGWDIKIAANGLGLASTRFDGSGWNPLRELNTSTDQLSIRSDATGSGAFNEVRQRTQINRGADRSYLFMTESNSDAGPIFGYDASTDTFDPSADTNNFLDNAQAAVSRDGTKIALELNGGLSIMDQSFSPLHFFTSADHFDGGMIFDPVRDVLYVADTAGNTLEAVNTNTWLPFHSWNIGEDIGSSLAMDDGVMSISDDGTYLAMSTPSGVRLFEVPEPTIISFALVVAPILVSRRRRRHRQPGNRPLFIP